MSEDIIYRLRKRAEIRRQIPNRKAVEEGLPDRLANLLDEAADEIEKMRRLYSMLNEQLYYYEKRQYDQN